MTRRGYELLAMIVGGLVLTLIAYDRGWLLLMWVAGGYTCLGCDSAVREGVESLRPATRVDRRRARRMVQAANRGGPLDPTTPQAGG